MEYGFGVGILLRLSLDDNSPKMKSPADPESIMAETETLKLGDINVTEIVSGEDTEGVLKIELTIKRGGRDGHNRRKWPGFPQYKKSLSS